MGVCVCVRERERKRVCQNRTFNAGKTRSALFPSFYSILPLFYPLSLSHTHTHVHTDSEREGELQVKSIRAKRERGHIVLLYHLARLGNGTEGRGEKRGEKNQKRKRIR